MPKRNRRELRNTRFYLDRNSGLFHEVLSNPKWMSREEVDHFDKVFLAHMKATEQTKQKRDDILATQKQFTDPKIMYEALERNEYAFGPTYGADDAHAQAEAMDPETLAELGAGFHASSPIIPSHLQQSNPGSKEYWNGILVDSYEEDLLEEAPSDIPFSELQSKEANAAVSMVKLHSHFKKTRRLASVAGKQQVVQTFGHVSGNLQCKARFPLEDAGLNGLLIMTDERREKDLHLKKTELKHVQTCNKWLQNKQCYLLRLQK